MRHRLILLVLVGVLAGALSVRATEPVAATEESPAIIAVSGAGFWRNRELARTLRLLLGAQLGTTLDGNATEDAALMLLAALSEEGFQKPTLQIEATLVDGTGRQLTFDTSLVSGLPRPLKSRAVEFHVEPGVRWHLASLEITGLTVLSAKTARALFRDESMWLVLARTNAYSKSHVANSVRALLGALRSRGYADATVETEVVSVDAASGAVALRVAVTQGDHWVVTAVRIEGADQITRPADPDWIGRPWSAEFRQELKESIRRACYRQGYPDVSMSLGLEPESASHGQVSVGVVVRVQPGPSVTIRKVRFVGNAVTREAVLRRAVPLETGAPFDPLALANARYRISRLGVFDTVELSADPVDGTVRDPVFTVRESERTEANLLLGYGSYEQLRGGIEFRHHNRFGRAHAGRLLLVQSIKSTNADYTYTVPELFGKSIDGAARLFALQRQEVAFLRQEYGVNLSLKRPIPWLHAEGMLGYTFQVLRNRDNELATEASDQTQLNVGSVEVGLSADHRDNPLRPRRGYRWFTRVEHAARNLGGSSEYQRLELGAAYHTPWGEGHWLHFGLTHGVITTFGTTDALLPVNKRFYPGGENSIRGYQDGEAAPRGEDGLFVGAKSYLLFNFELEQALTRNWSLVALFDALGIAARLQDYPFSERLYTAGLGVRYQTLIGPVRVEYGRNLNPRPLDPGGTWQISIGYPF